MSVGVGSLHIDGYSFVRNGESLGYSFVESLLSYASVCDEVVVAVGMGDPCDRTRDRVVPLGYSLIRILGTGWDARYFDRGAINAIQFDLAKSVCSGDWLLYLQADEVLHEPYVEPVLRPCRTLLTGRRVHGLSFRFRHFWGDDGHWVDSHAWYAAEIRVIRN